MRGSNVEEGGLDEYSKEELKEVLRVQEAKIRSIARGITLNDLKILGFVPNWYKSTQDVIERGYGGTLDYPKMVRMFIILNRSKRHAKILALLIHLQVKFKVLFGYLRWKESISDVRYIKVCEDDLTEMAKIGQDVENTFKVKTDWEEEELDTHKFHILDFSPWPFFTSISVLSLVLGSVLYMHYDERGLSYIVRGVLCLLVVLCFWWRDVIRESTYLGHHTSQVQYGLRLGFILFLVSEVLFFFGFFWAFFHCSLAPAVEIGSIWPPYGIVVMDPLGIPLLNTFILLFSAIAITYSHYSLLSGDFLNIGKIYMGFFETIMCAILFSVFQFEEYYMAPFAISDGIFGSVFYFITGLHGFHVIIGTLFIVVSFLRFLKSHYLTNHHLGFEFSIWYWHFVDLVWLYVFVFVYVWSSI